MNSTTMRIRSLRRAGAVLAMGAAFSLAAACATEVTGSAKAPGVGQQTAGQQTAGQQSAAPTGSGAPVPPMSGSEGAPPAPDGAPQESDGAPRESDDGMGTASAQLPDQTATFEPPTVSGVVPKSIDPGGSDPDSSGDVDQPTARADTGGDSGGDSGGGVTSSGGSHGVPETAGGEAPAAGTGALNWPDDVCSLLPEGIEEDIEKQESDPTLRCMYSGTSDEGEYQMVTLLKVGRINPDDPMGGNGTDLREEKIGGDASWSYQQDKTSVAVVAVGDDGFSVALAYDGASEDQIRETVVKLAGHVLEQLTA